MSTLADIKERTQEMMQKTAPRSITPLELGQLLVDMQEIIELMQTTLQTSLAELESNDAALAEALLDKVDAVPGKGLSTNDYSNEEKQKLSRLSEQEQADWNETDSSSKAFVRNKPSDVSDFVNDAGYVTASDNVATATKLATPRTLWGQTFDGSSNVAGGMTGVPSIAAGESTYYVQQLSKNGWATQQSTRLMVTNYLDGSVGVRIIQSLDGASTLAKMIMSTDFSPIVGHKHILIFRAKANADNLYIRIGIGNAIAGNFGVRLNTDWTKYAYLIPPCDSLGLHAEVTRYRNTDDVFFFKDFMVFDLTAWFGEGNEPASTADFAQRLGLQNINDMPYIAHFPTPIPLKNSVALGGDLFVGGLPIRRDMVDEKIEVINIEGTSAELCPGKLYQFGTVTSLNITLLDNGRTDIEQEYRFRFTCGQDNMSYVVPWELQWEIRSGWPTMVNGHTYEISIVNGYATFLEFE
ncbi:MAG: hypothetical protein IKR18_11550 [Bacteroidaceae bacterium]|nr:hypothetical protein [Bacteroidaceae bacterium]